LFILSAGWGLIPANFRARLYDITFSAQADILAFAERILPRAADLWTQSSLQQRQRFQQLFFPDGIAFDGDRFVGTGATAPAFSYLREIRTDNEGVVDQNSASWNPLIRWLLQLDRLRAG